MSMADAHRLPYWFDLALDILGLVRQPAVPVRA